MSTCSHHAASRLAVPPRAWPGDIAARVLGARMRRRFFNRRNILGAVLVFAAALASPAGDAPEIKAVQGAWTPVKAELGGQPMADSVLKTISLKLHDGNYEVLVAGHADKGTYTIDPATSPKSMTIIGTEGPNKGRTFPAIYELEADTLRICYDLSGQHRPTEFKTAAGTRLYLVTYSRAHDRPSSAH